MKKFSDMKSDLMDLALPIGLAIVKATPNLDIVFTNEVFTNMLGFEDSGELMSIYKSSAWNFVYRDDMQMLKAFARSRIGVTDPYEIAYRAVKKDGSLIWVNQNSRHTYDEEGNEIIFAYYTDITRQKQMEEAIRAGVARYETLVNSIPGGIGMFHIDDKLTPIFMSDGAYALCNMTKEEYEEATQNSNFDIFHPDDRQGFLDALNKALTSGGKFEYIHRVLQKDGSYRWMRVSGRLITEQDKEQILYTVFTDVHEQIQAERALMESEFRNAAAIKAANINIWEYNYGQDTMSIFSTSPRVNLKGAVLPDYLRSVEAEGHIREDSAPILYGMIDKLKNGEKEVSADLWIRERADDEFWCERVIYTNIFDEDGKPMKAYCVGRDVTREKEAEKRYSDELSYREAMQTATMASINVNLTQNTVLDYKSNFSQVVSQMSTSRTAQEYFEKIYEELTTEEMREKCKSTFSRDALLRRFASGETTLSMEVQRKIEGRIYWVVMTAYMMKRTENQNIVAFLYSTDITNERTMQNVMNAIVKTDYDFLVVIDGLRNSATRYSGNDFGKSYAVESDNFESETQEYIRRFICPEDVERVVKEITIKNICSQLNANETYNIFYGTPASNGQVFSKQLRFSYINREMMSILMTRIDITAAVEEQEKKNQQLIEAVDMAERANAAKSEFLSRISHEIRTPMNAIMGMDQLAIQHLQDTEFVQECIEKSQYASQYLLLLLNDILDMSKIESGKVTLKKEIIDCDKFLDSVATIIDSQAQSKGVEYVVTEFENHECSYLGDGVRLQQILINILSNAVKFTPKGGRVSLNITRSSFTGKTVNIRFKVTDTGIGISKEFLPNLFKPFSQEHSGSGSGYGGSGLGLAISKNLAQLMGGDISVQSALGKGTSFIVDIPLEIPPQNTHHSDKPIPSHPQSEYDFNGKTILLVEDHQLNIMVATKLLEFKNAKVEVAENGKIALDMIA
ncbi:MAG: ATP-binding protein, partial [Oscillospiraceae bacterium]